MSGRARLLIPMKRRAPARPDRVRRAVVPRRGAGRPRAPQASTGNTRVDRDLPLRNVHRGFLRGGGGLGFRMDSGRLGAARVLARLRGAPEGDAGSGWGGALPRGRRGGGGGRGGGHDRAAPIPGARSDCLRARRARRDRTGNEPRGHAQRRAGAAPVAAQALSAPPPALPCGVVRAVCAGASTPRGWIRTGWCGPGWSYAASWPIRNGSGGRTGSNRPGAAARGWRSPTRP